MLLRDSTNNYRGGVRLEYNRWHVTLEEGGTTYKDDDQASANGANFGDRTTPILGGTLVLNTLTQTYGVRGSSVYSKVLATASPFSWLDLNGQFLYSKPKTDARYFDIATGNFALLSSLLLYSGQYNIGTSASNAKHTLANAGAEIRPFKRLKIIDSFSINRYNETGVGALTEQILLTPGATFPALVSALATPQAVTNNRQQVEAILDVTTKITLRGGYRYEWGDATVRAGTLDQSGSLAFGALKRNVGLAGADHPSLAEALPERGLRRRLHRPELLPHQPVQLPEGAGAGEVSGGVVALVPGEFHAARQPESHRGHPVRFPQPRQFAGRVLDAQRRQAHQRHGGV